MPVKNRSLSLLIAEAPPEIHLKVVREISLPNGRRNLAVSVRKILAPILDPTNGPASRTQRCDAETRFAG
jgi:hypothetical protein